MSDQAFAEIAVALPVRGTYSYRVPPRLDATCVPGSRVLVPFGNRGVTGVVVARRGTPSSDAETIRDVDAVLDEVPAVTEELLPLCAWIAEYYEAPIGEVLRAALPAGSQVNATPTLALTDAGRAALAGEGAALARKHREILAHLDGAGGSATQRALTGRARARLADLRALVAAGLLDYERVAERARVTRRTERWAVLARELTDDDRAALARATKKRAVLAALEAAGGAAAVAALKREIARAADHLRGLAKDGFVRFEERDAPLRTASAGRATDAGAAPPEPNERQRQVLASIAAAMGEGGFRAFLLHGVTGSGKTEVYLRAIADAVAAGRGAVVLVPEISLTPQLASRFRARFGDLVAVLHSALSDRERFDEWQRLRGGEARIALGARSAIFAPVADLAVVVVDEEHDSSFKQEEGVRYNARDVALVRAQRAGAVCILGSATPSLESFDAAEAGRYELASLPERATPRPLPEVEVIDLKTYMAEDEAMLTAPLAAAIADTLARDEQVILFLNRRGFSTFVLCRACGHAFRCTQCSVSLTYHRSRDRLLCHYCGYQTRVPDVCPECKGEDTIVKKGLGTEKVADAIAARFPDARVARLDRDVAAGPKIEAILGRVARREVDILVGTQMVTKGHDFPGVTLVGVLCADTGLSLPDFRASERTFQLLTQVAGRAGRGDRAGRVIIQTFRPEAVAVAAAARQDYLGFYRAERTDRAELGYPPLGYQIAVRFDGPGAAAVAQAARQLAEHARETIRRTGVDVALRGPVEAPLARLKGRTRWHLWLRGPQRRALRGVVRAVVDPDSPPVPGVRVTVDVDPISAL